MKKKRKLTPEMVAEYINSDEARTWPFEIDTDHISRKMRVSYSTARIAVLEAVGLGLIQMKWTHQHRKSWLSVLSPLGGWSD